MYQVLDLFSAAAGGWTLGMDRAGFSTIAACESEAWRRALYSENFPHVRLYDDVRTLTGARLAADGVVPDVVVGSPPCQDISAAKVSGRGVDGAQSGLFFEAVRIIGECRPRWFALENSPYLRTRGIDRVLAGLEAHGYASEPFVVGADDAGANHERKRVWIIGFDPDQVVDAARLGRTGRRAWGHRAYGYGRAPDAPCVAGNANSLPLGPLGQGQPEDHGVEGAPAERADRGGALGPGADQGAALAGPGAGLGDHDRQPWADWNGGLARHLHDDDGLSAQLADVRFQSINGFGKTASAASFITEALGDAVIPQIPEAIGHAILRTEAAVAALYGVAA